jgi:hypothetical protein
VVRQVPHVGGADFGDGRDLLAQPSQLPGPKALVSGELQLADLVALPAADVFARRVLPSWLMKRLPGCGITAFSGLSAENSSSTSSICSGMLSR